MFVTASSLALALLSSLATPVSAFLNATETDTHFIIQNDHLYVAVNKTVGQITELEFDSQDLLGPVQGSSGKGPYLDCNCIPGGYWAPGSNKPQYQFIHDTDSAGVSYAGLVMSDQPPNSNQTLFHYFFIRDGETGMHTFSRMTYYNESLPFLRDLGEFRSLLWPNTTLWTHISSSDGNNAHLPSALAYNQSHVVQDATWYMGRTTSDPYVDNYSDYFTKYSFAELWRDHDVHGQYADGSQSDDGSVFGAWMIHNTRETYYMGPLKSDLVVDGHLYNYMISGHHGAPVPNITHGFDRTWGPQYYHFNKGPAGTPMEELRADAAQYFDPLWNADFYDDIAQYVPNYAPSSERTTFVAHVDLPEGAQRPLAVLAENGQDFQLNVFDNSALQYWADIDPVTGNVEIPRVVQGTYRLTVFADGVFGWFIQDDVVISASEYVATRYYTWTGECAGREVWRLGVPDKSAGEYLHGYAPDTSKPLQPEAYRIYWGAYDFPSDFPNGVNFHIGESDEARDWNYMQWSIFLPGYMHNETGTPRYYTYNINNWTVTFDLTEDDLRDATTATLTVQLAGVKTAAGNNKWGTNTGNTSHAGVLGGETYINLPYTVALNDGSGDSEQTWIIPYWRSSSCGVRSGIICQNVENKFVFDATKALVAGTNTLVLSLPFNTTNPETGTPIALYVQYDALRFELA